MRRLLLPLAFAFLPSASLAHDEPRIAVPQHYVVRTHCTPGRGFFAAPQLQGQAPALPFLAMFVFNGEVTGFLLEVDAKEGWKPWYDQPEGRPISHYGGPKHYTQTAMIRKGPAAEECKAATMR